MRTGAAAGHHGYLHDAACYADDEEFLAVVVPFLAEGVAAGEPTFAVFGEQNTALLRSALPDAARSGVRFDAEARYLRPAGTVKAYRDLFTSLVAEGATQIRLVGEVPTATATWDWWCRYESAVNHVYDEFPLWGLCTYDARVTDAAVLADVARTHPTLVTPGSRLPSREYIDPKTYLSRPRPFIRDPLHRTPPACELIDPSASRARQAIYAAAPGRLGDDEVDDLVVAVSETVTNALRHGRPPVRMRVWTTDERMVVAVTDAGPGPRDPMAGLVPCTDRAAGGLGLWITYQSCSHVSFDPAPEGFTVWLTAGDPDFRLQSV